MQEEHVVEVRVFVCKILKVELECVRHCDRIWIMVNGGLICSPYSFIYFLYFDPI